MSALTAADIERDVEAEAFTPLGWFHAGDDDGVPRLADGASCASVLMIGNAGPAMWQRFTAERASLSETMDEWSGAVLDRLAGRLGAHAHYPFARPPLPFQRWAARAGTVHTSPLGMSIHAEFGLWHAYRGAFAFADEIALPDPPSQTSPCDSCADKPCLATCPVGAFTGSGYDVPACAAHLGSAHGKDCMDLGCRARRACPVGRDYVYEPAQALFHMSAFLRARSQNG
jgi:hypothetical protein